MKLSLHNLNNFIENVKKSELIVFDLKILLFNYLLS